MSEEDLKKFIEANIGKDIKFKRAYNGVYTEGVLVKGTVRPATTYLPQLICDLTIDTGDLKIDYAVSDLESLKRISYDFVGSDYYKLDYEELSDLFYKPLSDEEWLEFFKILSDY